MIAAAALGGLIGLLLVAVIATALLWPVGRPRIRTAGMKPTFGFVWYAVKFPLCEERLIAYHEFKFFYENGEETSANTYLKLMAELRRQDFVKAIEEAKKP